MLNPSAQSEPPLIAHLIYRLDFGGLENGLVNIINHMPEQAARHCIVCLTDFNPLYAKRLTRQGVKIFCLHKKEGKDWLVWRRLYRLLKQLKPILLHTRNLPALEGQLVGWLLKIPVRIHSEHGRGSTDLYGDNKKYQCLRRLVSFFVHRYIVLSHELMMYLCDKVGINRNRITLIHNGVDSERYQPIDAPVHVDDLPFSPDKHFIIGMVGRMDISKAPMDLVQAFKVLKQRYPNKPLKLCLIGQGDEQAICQAFLAEHNLIADAWLPGVRQDVPALLQNFDVLVLPSLVEGLPNIVLEAMSCAKPVVATAVCGTPELVQHGETGYLVQPKQPEQLAASIGFYLDAPEKLALHGAQGRALVLEYFTLTKMINNYHKFYQEQLACAVLQAS